MSVAVCGANESGQCGIAVADAVPRPVFPVLTQQISAVALGDSHALWLTADGIVLSMGLNDVGQCGLSTPELVESPTRMEALATKRVVQVRAGASFSAALTDQGAILTFGANDFGQVSLGPRQGVSLHHTSSPTDACPVACRSVGRARARRWSCASLA